MILDKRWILIQPTHRNGGVSPQNMPWTNDSFRMLSKQFNAACYHIQDENIPLDADGYIMCSFDANLAKQEIDFLNKVRANGAKTLLGFSHDGRFLVGGGLLNEDGYLWTSVCEATDVISSGVNPELKIYGRFQHKVIPLGEVVEDLNWSIPFEERPYDLIGCGTVSEQSLSIQLEFLLMAKEKYPNQRIACVIAGHHEPLIKTLRIRYPQMEFPLNIQQDPNLISYLRKAKVFFNPELRPRPARALNEAYYCRTPYISASTTYHSRLCSEFAYDSINFEQMMNKYDAILKEDSNEIVKRMEERAKFDMFDQFYGRITKAFGW
jgi:hypothetical protein